MIELLDQPSAFHVAALPISITHQYERFVMDDDRTQDALDTLAELFLTGLNTGTAPLSPHPPHHPTTTQPRPLNNANHNTSHNANTNATDQPRHHSASPFAAKPVTAKPAGPNLSVVGHTTTTTATSPATTPNTSTHAAENKSAAHLPLQSSPAKPTPAAGHPSQHATSAGLSQPVPAAPASTHRPIKLRPKVTTTTAATAASTAATSNIAQSNTVQATSPSANSAINSTASVNTAANAIANSNTLPPASAPSQTPASHPRSDDQGHDNLMPETAHVQAVLLGNLPGLAGPWATQYAQAMADEDGQPVLLIHLDDALALDLIEPTRSDPTNASAPTTHPGQAGQSAGLSAGQLSPNAQPKRPTIELPRRPIEVRSVVQQLLTDPICPVRRVLVRMDPQTTPICIQRLTQLPNWVLLTGADDTAVIAGFRHLQSLAASDEILAQANVQVLVAGSEGNRARYAANRIAEAAQSALHQPIGFAGELPRMQPCRITQLGQFPADAADAQGLLAYLNGLEKPVEVKSTQTLQPVAASPKVHTANLHVADSEHSGTTSGTIASVELDPDDPVVIANVRQSINRIPPPATDTTTAAAATESSHTSAQIDASDSGHDPAPADLASNGVLNTATPNSALNSTPTTTTPQNTQHTGRVITPTRPTPKPAHHHNQAKPQPAAYQSIQTTTHPNSVASPTTSSSPTDTLTANILASSPSPSASTTFEPRSPISSPDATTNNTPSQHAQPDSTQSPNQARPSLANLLTASDQVLNDCVPLEATCPNHPNVELVLNGNGVIQLLATHEPGDHPGLLRDSLLDLMSVRRWVIEHQSLLALTQRQMRFDESAPPQMHLLTPRADWATGLIARLGDLLQIHLLAPVTVGTQTAWFTTPLNAAQ